jgi:hypothetical protein
MIYAPQLPSAALLAPHLDPVGQEFRPLSFQLLEV